MRILVFSDTHGDVHTITGIVRQQSTAEIVIHCGDGEEQSQRIKEQFPDKMVIAVKGNCDWGSSLNLVETRTFLGKKLYITHGHMQNVKSTLQNLYYAAAEENADIVLFGHTHSPLRDYIDGMHILNPGSCRGYGATYAFIDMDEKGIFTNIVQTK